MKILFFIPQLVVAGAEKALVNFVNDLVARGHQVEVLELYERGLLKPQFDERISFDAICSHGYTEKYYASLAQIKAAKSLKEKVVCVGKQIFSKVVGYRRFAEKLAARRYVGKEYDVAVNYLETESPEFLLNHVHARKYLQWIHIDVENLENPAELDQYLTDWNRVDGIVCVSQKAVDSFASRYPSLKEKIYLIYNFYNQREILRKAEEPVMMEGDRPLLLSVGRMTEQKKYLRFLDVLVRLRDEGYIFSWHVLGDGAQRQEIEQKIRDLHLQDRVFLHGVKDNPYKYMKNCDLFVLPSGWEGFPTVTVEAKILGCPVLATDVAGIREQLRHGETGWIVESSEEALYEGARILLNSQTLRTKISNNDKVDTIYNNEKKYLDFYQLIMNVK